MLLQIYLFLCLWISKCCGHLMRLPCSTIGNLSATNVDFALDGYLIKSFENLTVRECEYECLHHPLCRSIQTKNGSGINCQLNNKSAANPFDLATLSSLPGWTFRSTNYSESNIGELCLKVKPCMLGMTCTPSCICPGYQCVQSIPGPFKSCADAYSQGFRETKAYQIDLPDIGVIGVRCDMTTDGGGWTVFQRRIDNSVDFSRNWKEYKNGFGDLDGNFWLGLDKLHQLAGPGKQAILRVDLKHMDHSIKKFAKYTTFQVAGESDDYRLTVGDYTGNAEDSLSYHSGGKFSSKDRDNDLYDLNCAALFLGAWWFKACHYSNLNGLYPPDNTEDPSYMGWIALTGKHGKVTFSEMKLKHVD